jgi:hypothetical protein
MFRHELIVCWSDGTWTDCNFTDSNKEMTREEAENQFVSCYITEKFAAEKGKRDGLEIEKDITYVGILNVEEVENETE